MKNFWSKKTILAALALGCSAALLYFFTSNKSNNFSETSNPLLSSSNSQEGENLQNLINDSSFSLKSKKEEILNKLKAQVVDLEREASSKKDKTKKDKAEKDKAKKDKAQQNSAAEAQKASNKTSLKKAESTESTNNDFLQKIESYKSEIFKLNAELAENKGKVDVMSKELNALKKADKSSELEKELISLKSNLKLKEEEVYALNKKLGILPQESPVRIKQVSNNATSSKVSEVKTSKINPPAATVVSRNASTNTGANEKVTTTKDLTIKILVPKANLRTGPGEEHGVLQQVPMGVTLLAEARIGDWYRIIAPTGKRAFISSKVVEPMTGGNIENSSVAPVKGPALKKKPQKRKAPPGFVPFDGSAGTKKKKSTAEEKAFELLKKKIQEKKLKEQSLNK